MTSIATAVALKRTLRKELKTVLKAVSGSTLASESETVVQHLLDSDVYKKSRNISVYISMPSSEINTRSIIHDILHSSDKACYVPRWTADAMEMVRIKSWQDYLDLPINKWNIPEPPHDTPMENAFDHEGLDLILVPAMGFDENRNRIGHGKGYYDKYIESCRVWAKERQCQPPKTVGLALREQLLKGGNIPTEPTDQKLDCIITPDRIICE
ncbi:hypothetical protein BCR43DRAFT_478955 [Syncephalastrum racemosum]|uniref:5-formyltetrahydrofolate cyclo-ligase n=1 Tax=Syncephalastrum racemosum TaxID=13706 RepID=A0A1X2H283_SYNRA|nr:hypothetical protein BCR43DRAFT_478955 [Syncephalastrum racemosum]